MDRKTDKTWQTNIGTAFIVVAVLAGLSTLIWLAWWMRLDRRYFDVVGMPAWIASAAGLFYLALAAMIGFSAGWKLRQTQGNLRLWAWMATAHAVVLITVVLITVRGATSRANLASLHYLIAAMAVTSCLGWIMSMAARWLGRHSAGAHSDTLSDGRRWEALLLLAGCLAAGSLAYLEAQSLPVRVEATSHKPHLGGP